LPGDNLGRACKALGEGLPVFIHDSSSREDEVDMVFYAPLITPSKVALMRREGGGLICYAMPLSVGRVLGLRYMDEILREAGYSELASKRLGYGDPPNFSLWVNHKDVVTGIRDADRAKTIKELDTLVEDVLQGRVKEARDRFVREFVAPGHVPVLLGRGLSVRKGHTELSLALAEMGGLRPSVVIVEMLDEGGAASVSRVSRLAERVGGVLIEGADIIEAWERSLGL